jgi:hypothetical protein
VLRGKPRKGEKEMLMKKRYFKNPKMCIKGESRFKKHEN